MTKIYVKAYCKNNFGDDLFIKILANRYPHVTFFLNIDKKFNNAFISDKNIKVAPKFYFIFQRLLNKVNTNILKKMEIHLQNKFDALIYIGGSIFIENPEWKNNKKIIGNKNTFFLGSNFGPYKSQEFLDNTFDCIKNSVDCCFRDSYSFNIFKNLTNVRYESDIIFSYKKLPERKKGSGIGISVICLDNRSELSEMKNLYYKNIIEICNMAIKNDLSVYLYSFCDYEGDIEAIYKIVNKIKRSNKIHIISYKGNCAKFLEELNNCEYLFATRFHAMILGWCLNKKVIPIIYSNKQMHIISDIEFNGYIWNLLEKKYIPGEELYNNGLGNKTIDITKYVVSADNQFRVLDDFIQKINS